MVTIVGSIICITCGTDILGVTGFAIQTMTELIC